MVDVKQVTIDLYSARSPPQGNFHKYKYTPHAHILISCPTQTTTEYFKPHIHHFQPTSKQPPPIMKFSGTLTLGALVLSFFAPAAEAHGGGSDRNGFPNVWSNCEVAGEKRCMFATGLRYQVQFCDENYQWVTFEKCPNMECEYRQRYDRTLGTTVYEPYCPQQGWNQAPWEDDIGDMFDN
jgi:hypothetical protein